MNEYQDQEVWFEVQGKYNGRWEMVTSEDTRALADETKSVYETEEPGTAFRVRRVYGLTADDVDPNEIPAGWFER